MPTRKPSGRPAPKASRRSSKPSAGRARPARPSGWSAPSKFAAVEIKGAREKIPRGPRAPALIYKAPPAGTFAPDVAKAIREGAVRLGKGEHRVIFRAQIDPKKPPVILSRQFTYKGDSLARRGAIGKLRGLEKKLGQKALARALGVNQRTIRKWKTGTVMRQASLDKLSKALAANKRKPLKVLTGGNAFMQSWYSAIQWFYKKFPRGTSPVILSVSHVSAKTGSHR